MRLSVSRHFTAEACLLDPGRPTTNLAGGLVRPGLRVQRGQAGHSMKAFRRATARARLVTCGLYDIDIPVQTIVRSYDFVVLGSGIAGLTYATKVGRVRVRPPETVFNTCIPCGLS